MNGYDGAGLHTISLSNIENISCSIVGLKISPTNGIIRFHGYIRNLIVEGEMVLNSRIVLFSFLFACFHAVSACSPGDNRKTDHYS